MSDGVGLPPVLVKLGGSLLDQKDLAARLRGLFLSLSPAPVGIVVGGGAVTDVVREWDRRFGLGDDAAHRIAIRSMRVTELLVAELLPECAVAESREAAWVCWREGRPVILAVEALLAEAGADVPRASWEVTSDSLAAWAAEFVGARRLVLLKSVAEPAGGIAGAVEDGGVDPAFSEFANGLTVEWACLRTGD